MRKHFLIITVCIYGGNSADKRSTSLLTCKYHENSCPAAGIVI